jgi:glutathione peroxidase
MSIFDQKISAVDGRPFDFGELAGRAVLIVNVASRCGLTPQYTALEELQRTYAGRGLTVLGVPCSQFGGQESDSADDISTFCSASFGVTFPLTEKADVNGQKQHPLFRELTAWPDAEGVAGEVEWNFEKFLISPAGEVVGRFRPQVVPESTEVVSAVEAVLPF